MSKESSTQIEFQKEMKVRIVKSQKDHFAAMPNEFLYKAGQEGIIEDITIIGTFRSIYLRLTTGKLIVINNESHIEQI